ncbi:MAG: hypothetical protein H7Y01_06015 [Ferruginibacter sp.]|nr:hypothetical protein [Chitinophagaceae bacterium]
MKKLWFFAFLLSSITGTAQPAVKIFAYSQETTPGNIPKDVTDENGKPQGTKKGASINYYFYGAYTPSVKISFCEVWIGSKYYKVQTEVVNSTPVVVTNYNIPDRPVEDVLVPASKLRVMSITPVGSPTDKIINTSWFRKLLRQSELIVSYLYKGKKYFIPVKKIKILAPVAGI